MPSARPTTAPAPTATSGAGDERAADPLAQPQVFRAGHAGDWCAAALILAVPLATGADLWRQVGWASDAGRLVFLALALVGLGGAACYAAARVAVRVVVAPEGIAATRGPWRNALVWHEIARLRERTEAVERHPVRWLVAEAHDGRRLRIHEDVVGDYPRFRATVYAAHQRWRALGAAGAVGAADASGAFGPVFLAREMPGAAGWLAGAALTSAGVALYLGALVVPLRLAALALGIVAVGLGAGSLLVRARRRSFALDEAGIEAWSRMPTVRLDWHAITWVQRRRPLGWTLIQMAGWTSDRLHQLLAGRACWTGDRPWPRHAPEMLLLRGGGRRLELPLHRLREPEGVLARVTHGVEAARQAARETQTAVARSMRARATVRLPRASAPAPGGASEATASAAPGVRQDDAEEAADATEATADTAPDASAGAAAAPEAES